MPNLQNATDPKPRNAFAEEFLRKLMHVDEPLSAAEADSAGPWQVVSLADDEFGLFRVAEGTEREDVPNAKLNNPHTAELMAAALPAMWRRGAYSYERRSESHEDDLLYCGQHVGYVRYNVEEVTEALNLLDGLARNPVALARFLKGAGRTALELAGKILARELVQESSPSN
ncbi:MAG: hypothetical protein GY856_49685 [bacterium]|nr:hypothetical protein [bacterium]